MLQIASQQLKQCRNGGGRMPRNPRPDTIGTGGRITPEYARGTSVDIDSQNFSHLMEIDCPLSVLATHAERYFVDDANTALI